MRVSMLGELASATKESGAPSVNVESTTLSL